MYTSFADRKSKTHMKQDISTDNTEHNVRHYD